MSYCSKCGNKVSDSDIYCYKCGISLVRDVSNNQQPDTVPEPIKETITLGQGNEETKLKKRGIRQSQGALVAVAAIIFTGDLLALISLMLGFIEFNPLDAWAFILDIFLGIFLLLGKKWARNWMLVRFIIGLIIWSLIYAVTGSFAEFLGQVGYCVAGILLLTGRSTALRIWGSVILYLFLFGAGFFVGVMQVIMAN